MCGGKIGWLDVACARVRGGFGSVRGGAGGSVTGLVVVWYQGRRPL